MKFLFMKNPLLYTTWLKGIKGEQTPARTPPPAATPSPPSSSGVLARLSCLFTLDTQLARHLPVACPFLIRYLAIAGQCMSFFDKQLTRSSCMSTLDRQLACPSCNSTIYSQLGFLFASFARPSLTHNRASALFFVKVTSSHSTSKLVATFSVIVTSPTSTRNWS